MTNFERTPVYDRVANFIDILTEDELNELSVICRVKAQVIEEERHERERLALMEDLQEILSAIKRAGYQFTIENADNPNWCVQIRPDEIYSIKLKYVGK